MKNLFILFALLLASCGNLTDGSAPGNSSSSSSSSSTSTASRKIVFLSSQRFNYTTGRAAGDTLCNSLASSAGLSGTYVAWLSDSTYDAIDLLSITGPWYLADQTTMVYASKSKISTTNPLVPINQTENKVTISGGSHTVMTGTNNGGTAATSYDCNEWTDNTNVHNGVTGDYTSASTWTNAGTTSCNIMAITSAYIYCFQNN